jgi:hypothetical protein
MGRVNTNVLFLVFALFVGLTAGNIIMLVPQSRTIGLEPYYWVLIALALFEIVVFLRRGGAGGPPVTMLTRLSGFIIALALMFLIPMVAGIDVKYF